MQLILVDTSNLRLTKCRSRSRSGSEREQFIICLFKSDFCPRSRANNNFTRRDEDIVRDQLISEINSDDVLNMYVLLSILDKNKGKLKIVIPPLKPPYMSIMEKLHNRFQDKVKISVYLMYKAMTRSGEIERIEFASVEGKMIDPKGFKCAATTTAKKVGLVAGFRSRNIANLKIIADVPDSEIPFAQKLLYKGSSSDVIIYSGNGAEIKGHKCFLSVCSPVLAAKLDSDSGMEEPQTGQLDMSDMSEEGVRAFLRYVYYGDLAEPRENAHVAYELLYAGHKYFVPHLEAEMITCLMGKKSEDFNARLALKVYMFVRNIQPFVEMKERIVQVLKSKLDELELLPEYKDLFSTTSNSRIAMEIFRDFAQD